MWNYEKRLEYPIKHHKIQSRAIAKIIISQFGGPDGELSASLRYLSQRYAMPYREVAGVLTDIGTEELAHLEMVATIVHQLTQDLTRKKSKKWISMPTTSIIPQGLSEAAAVSRSMPCEYQSKGDAITDLFEDLAAEGAIV